MAAPITTRLPQTKDSAIRTEMAGPLRSDSVLNTNSEVDDTVYRNMGDLRRLYVGGLFEKASQEDVVAQFSKFGEVDSVEIKEKRDFSGNFMKKYAYVNLHLDDTMLKKCFTTYNKTKWKGSELKIQLAKEDFIKRLEEERKHHSDEEELPETDQHVHFEEKFDVNELKSKTPGTVVPGEKNWVVGKYGRIMPVVYIRRKDKQKVTKIDPSKYSHNLKKLKETEDMDSGEAALDNLTWTLDEKESENDRKRRGIFPKCVKKHSGKKVKPMSQSVDNTGSEHVVKDLTTRYTPMDSDEEFEICKVSTVKLSELPGFVRKKHSKEEDDSSYDSAGTDEIIASSKTICDQINVPQPIDKKCAGNKSSSNRKVGTNLKGKNSVVSNRDDISSSDEGSFQNRKCKTLLAANNKKSALKTKPMLMEFKGTRAAFSDECDSDMNCGVSENKKATEGIQSKLPATSKSASAVYDSDSSENDSSEIDRKSRHTNNQDEKQPPNSAKKQISNSSKKLRKVKGTPTTDSKHNEEHKLEKKDYKNENRTLRKTESVIQDTAIHKTQQVLKEKHEDDNRKRLESLKQKVKENTLQKSLIKQALANVDKTDAKPSNRRVVFDSDSDNDTVNKEATNQDRTLESSSSDTSLSKESSSSQASSDEETDDEEECADKNNTPHRKQEVEEKHLKRSTLLFESESEDASDSEDAFKHKPEFEGKKGSKLMKLQSRFQSDKRFKMSEKFLESDLSDDEEAEHTNEDHQGEKLRSLEILREVMGGKMKLDLDERSKQKKLFRDISALQYDPSKEDHKQFEREKLAATKKKKSVSDKAVKGSSEEEKVESEPKVSREKYFQVESSVSDTFKRKNDAENTGFSLLKQFGVVQEEDEAKTAEEQQVETVIKKLNPLVDDSSDDDDYDDDYKMEQGDESVNNNPDVDAKSKTETVVFPPRKQTFFFTADDYRFQEGIQFYRKESLEIIRWKWLDQREELRNSYKSKHKGMTRNAKVKGKTFHKKRS